jgi:DNA-binding MarR family transcriptional regulator
VLPIPTDENRGPVPYKQFQDMLDAYRRTIGGPYADWQIADVLKVFEYLVSTPKTWQKQVCDATGVHSSKVNRMIDVAEEQGWVERPKSRTPDAKKPLQMSTRGRQVTAEFETLCREAVGTAPPISRAGGKKSVRKSSAAARGRSGYLSPELVPDRTRTVDK